MKKTIIISLAVILLGVAAVLLLGFKPDRIEVPSSSGIPAGIASSQSLQPPAFELQGMEGIVSNGALALYYDSSSAGIAIREETTGTVWYSNPQERDQDTIASSAIRNAMSSQVSLTYYNLSGQQSRMTSFRDSLAYDQVVAEPIEGGLRVSYEFGELASGLDLLPQKISRERYEGIIQRAGDTYARHLSLAYFPIADPEVYERYDEGLQGLVLRRTLEAFQLAGYTEEDLAQDNEEHNIDAAIADSEKFKVVIEYMLDGNEFVVRVPVEEVEYSESTPLTQIAVLEYFGAGTPEDEGYLFVPDGSGSLIYMNPEERPNVQYDQRIYGTDSGIYTTSQQPITQTARLPVFGIKKQETAILAIIEQSAAIASVKASTNGLFNSYNNVYADFQLRSRETIQVEAADTSRSIPAYSQALTDSDLVIRYLFLDGNEADYAGMAHAYQNYLTERNMLVRNGTDENVPFYLELIGSVPTRKSFMGVPYESMQSLTTFGQAQSILSELQELSVDNVKLRYTGWFNDGVRHSVPVNLNPQKALGGEKGLLELNAFVLDAGVSLFPDISLARLYPQSSRKYSSTNAAVRHLNRQTATIYPVDPATGYPDNEASPYYLLSPLVLPGIVDGFLGNYRSYDISAVSLRDLGDILYSDSRMNRQVDRTQTESIFRQQIQKLYEEMDNPDIMVEGGNAYVFPYARHIVNAPMSDSRFNITDTAVPFYQMVLHGFVDYTGEPYNLSQLADWNEYVMQSLEYGAGLSFTWIYESNSLLKETEFDYMYSVHYRAWIEQAAAAYAEVNAVLRDVRGSRIIDHEILAYNVHRTEYEGGKYVIVNYNSYEVEADGMVIGAKDYYVGGAGG